MAAFNTIEVNHLNINFIVNANNHEKSKPKPTEVWLQL